MIASCKGSGERAATGSRSGSTRRLSPPCSALVLGLALVLHAPGAQGQTPPSDGLPYHNGPTSICADCHQPLAPVSERAGTEIANRKWSKAFPRLKLDDVNLVCLSCHDGVRGIPDVMGGDINGLKERSGGQLEIVTKRETHGHVLSSQLTCVSCHDPHGNGMPRNLRLPSSRDSTPRLGVFVRPGSVGLHRYERENVAYGTMDSPGLLELSALCLDCHGGLAGEKTQSVGGQGAYLLHPSYDSQHGATNRIGQGGMDDTTDPTYWDEGLGSDFEIMGRVPFLTSGAEDFAAAAEVDSERNGVFCLTCHPAHGSTHASGLRWAAKSPEGAGGCNQCHDKGRNRRPNQLTQALPFEK